MHQEAVQQMHNIMDVVQRVALQVTGRSVVEFGPLIGPTQAGFGLTVGNGLSMVFADVTGQGVDEWSIQFTSSIASDVPLFDDVARWVNDSNRQALHGKYYYVASRDGDQCVINWEVCLPSRIMNSMFKDSSKPVLEFVAAIINTTVEHASYTAAEFVKLNGGRMLRPDDAELFQLLMTSTGA